MGNSVSCCCAKREMSEKPKLTPISREKLSSCKKKLQLENPEMLLDKNSGDLSSPKQLFETDKKQPIQTPMRTQYKGSLVDEDELRDGFDSSPEMSLRIKKPLNIKGGFHFKLQKDVKSFNKLLSAYNKIEEIEEPSVQDLNSQNDEVQVQLVDDFTENALDSSQPNSHLMGNDSSVNNISQSQISQIKSEGVQRV